MKLTGEYLVERMTEAERERAALVEGILPRLREQANDVDRRGEFCTDHIKTLSESGLLGLIIPTEAYGGLGGGLRDLAAATFAMGVCLSIDGPVLFLPLQRRIARPARARSDRCRAVR